MRVLWQVWPSPPVASRPRLHPAPEGWSFIEATIEDENDTLFVYACSEECKAGVWKKGPGERWTAEEVVNA